MPDDFIASGATGGVAGLVFAFLKDAYNKYQSDKKEEGLIKRFKDLEDAMTNVRLDIAKNYSTRDDMDRLEHSMKLDHEAILKHVNNMISLGAEIKTMILERTK